MRRYRNTIAIVCAGLALLAALPARASVLLISITQAGANVAGLVEGSVDIDALPNSFDSQGAGLVYDTYPNGGSLIGIGSPTPVPVTGYYSGVVGGPASLGSAGFFLASSGIGDTIGLATDFTGDGTVVYVPTGYVSDDLLLGASVWKNASLASLGLTPGSYQYVLAPGVTIDLDIQIHGDVPEPATWMMALLGFGMIGYALRKRRTQAAEIATA